MDNSLLKIRILLFTFLFFLDCRGFSQVTEVKPVRVMFYNVENLFDIYNDTLKNDDDFLPKGVLRWNLSRYNSKISSLYKTIVASGEWTPPEIVAMCEVENRKVLEDLVYQTYLSKFSYHIIHEESSDPRGIDVCLIYRNADAKLINYCYWVPPEVARGNFQTRSVLYSKWMVNRDTLHIIVNHWPSRRGGVLANENLRMSIAQMVKEKADSINMAYSMGAKIVILGDFNCTPDDEEIKKLIENTNSENTLVNLSETLSDSGNGTYRYMGTWELIDQVIVSEKLLNNRNGLFTDKKMMNIFKADFLFRKDLKYPGFTPFSTYSGYNYQGGFSDHLPVYIDLKIRDSKPE